MLVKSSWGCNEYDAATRRRVKQISEKFNAKHNAKRWIPPARKAVINFAGSEREFTFANQFFEKLSQSSFLLCSQPMNSCSAAKAHVNEPFFGCILHIIYGKWSGKKWQWRKNFSDAAAKLFVWICQRMEFNDSKNITACAATSCYQLTLRISGFRRANTLLNIVKVQSKSQHSLSIIMRS